MVVYMDKRVILKDHIYTNSLVQRYHLLAETFFWERESYLVTEIFFFFFFYLMKEYT